MCLKVSLVCLRMSEDILMCLKGYFEVSLVCLEGS